MGEWKWAPTSYNPDSSDKAVHTSQDARFYGMSAKMDESFTNEGKDLIVQFTVKHEQDLDCGGAYIKLLGDMDQSKFGGDTPYQVMFGPDICGYSNRRTHVIFNYPPKGDNLLIKEDVRVETDKLSHLYTLVVHPDNSFEVFIDHESVRKGKLEEAFDFLPPKEVKDPAISKPADWVDEKMIPDPSDKKPADWDNSPAEIPDPEAKKPEDWDDEEDGEWEAPMIDNPDFKGPWRPKMIENPEYKGEWSHPMIPNPEYKEDKELYVRCRDCKYVGFELWQVKSGTAFDDIIVTDSMEEADAFAAEGFDKRRAPEKEGHAAAEEEERARAQKEAEERSKQAEQAPEDDEDGNDEL